MRRVKEGMTLSLTKAEARKLLRSKAEPGNIPFELIEILVSAYPECIRGEGEDNEVDYFSLLINVSHDFIPAFKVGKAQGRPVINGLGLVKAVNDLVTEKKKIGIQIGIERACNILAKHRFPGANRQRYYRELKKLYR